MTPMPRQLVLPIVALTGFALAALAALAQISLSLSAGHAVSLALADILPPLGVAPPPDQWMNGSVYDMLWNEQLVLVALAVGLLAATYAGIDRFEEQRMRPAVAHP